MKLEGHEWDVGIVQWDPQGVRSDGKRLLLRSVDKKPTVGILF
jgi:hypothetical protein